jgi:ssDNA-binding replication factor A large subunit
MKSILDSSFRYTPSSETDVRKTFERIRREQQAQIQEEEVADLTGSASFQGDRARCARARLPV